MVDSLLITNSQINNFWGLVDTVDNVQDNISTELADLNGQVGKLRTAAQKLNINSDKIQNVLSRFGDVGNTFSDIIRGLFDATASTAVIEDGLDTAKSAIEENVGGNIDTLRDNLEGPMLQFQTQGRIIAIVVIIGMILVCALILTWLCWPVPLKHPIVASSLVAVMLFFIFLVLLIGAGVGKSTSKVLDDACLYSETYAAVTLLNQVKDPTKQMWLTEAINFYLKADGKDGAPNEAGSAVSEVLGINLKPIKVLVQSGALNTVLGLLGNTLAQIGLNQVLEPSQVEAIGELADIVGPIANNIARIDELASRDTNFAIYERVKTLVCCEGADAVARLFLSWTIVGAFAFLFCVLCFWRIVSQVRENRRVAKAGGGVGSSAGGDEVIRSAARGTVDVPQDAGAALPVQAMTTGTTTTTTTTV